MPDFQKTLKSPEVQINSPQLQTNTGSVATDILAAGQFLLNTKNAVDAANAKRESIALQNQNAMDFNAGAVQAQRDLGKLSQIAAGPKQSMRKRQLQTEAINNLSPTALQGYLEVLKGSGIRLAVAEEQEAVQDAQAAQIKEFQNLVQEGRELVLASAADSSPEMQNLYKKYGEDGFSSDELAEISMINRGKRQIAQRRSAEISAQEAAFGLQRSQAKQGLDARVNEFMIEQRLKLDGPVNILTQAITSNNQGEVTVARDEIKRQVLQSRNQLNKFLSNLSETEKAVGNITEITSRFNALSEQMITLAEKVDPVQSNAEIIKAGMQSTMTGWLSEGTPAQKAVAFSVLNGFQPDPSQVQLSVREAVAGGNIPAYTQLSNKIAQVAGGNIDPNDSSVLNITQRSTAPATDKAPVAAQYVLKDPAAFPVHKPEVFRPLLALQKQIADDSEATREFVSMLEEDGTDVYTAMRDQHTSVIAKSIYPSLRTFGINEGMVRFVSTGNGLSFEFETANESAQRIGNPTVAFQATDLQARKALNKTSQLINTMAETSAKITGRPKSELLTVYAETLNLIMGTSQVQQEQEDGQN